MKLSFQKILLSFIVISSFSISAVESDSKSLIEIIKTYETHEDYEYLKPYREWNVDERRWDKIWVYLS